MKSISVSIMPLPDVMLVGTHRNYVIGELFTDCGISTNVPEERQIFNLVLPPWQRPEKWDEARKIKFIEGIFLGLGTGYRVQNGMDWDESGQSLPMSGWLIDGQQRVSAIRDFVFGKFCVFEDVFYEKMDRKTQLRRFLRVPFPCVELEYTADENVLVELYNRLAFGGVPHEESEIAKPFFL